MNPLFKFVLKIASSERFDMQEDYTWIRKIQRMFSKITTTKNAYYFLDNKIYSKDDDHEIPVRIFYPEEKKHDEYIIYIHGGGWVLGDIDTYSRACINLANELGRIVYSIDYRRAPEYPFPQGLEDCLQVVEVLLRPRKDKERKWILMGDSAGGNLAAALMLQLKEKKKALPEKLVLLYPVTYWDHTENSPFPSITKYGEDYGLTSKKIQEYMEMYAPDKKERKDPLISPLMAEDLTDFPDTLVITAEFDPIRDEGEAFGKALAEAGNRVAMQRIPQSVHGFITYDKNARPLQEAYQGMEQFLNDQMV